MFKINIVSFFHIPPQVYGLFKQEVLKCVELLCIKLNVQIQIVCQVIP